MFFPQIYKFDFDEQSSINRFSEFIMQNKLSNMPISENEDIHSLLISSIDSLHSIISKKSLTPLDQIEMRKNVELIVKIKMCDIPIVNDFFSKFNNDQLLFDVFEKCQSFEPKFIGLMLYFILKRDRLISNTPRFTEMFLQDFYETLSFEENVEQKYQLFDVLMSNLLINNDDENRIFNKEFLDHLSEVIEMNVSINEQIIPIIYYYCKIVDDLNETDTNEELIDYDFYDFLEKFITSLDYEQPSVRHLVARLLISVSRLNFYDWLFQEEFIKTVVIQLIQYSREDDYLFVLNLYLIRMNHYFVLSIKDPLYDVILEKCQKLIEIEKWSNIDNVLAKKIIHSLHYLYKYKTIGNEESCEHKMIILTFLINLLDKSIFSIKSKSLHFVSVYIQNFSPQKMTSEAMNLITNIFIRSIDLDDIDTKFLILSSYSCLFHTMQKTDVYEEFKNTFIENRVIDNLRDSLQNQAYDNDIYSMTNDMLNLLLEGFENENLT